MNRMRILAGVLAATLSTGIARGEDAAWWDKSWTSRQKLNFDTSDLGGDAGESTVLVRLYDGNFQFALAREDGSDIRIVAADGKTVLPHQIESYDNLLNEAYLWVKIPAVKGGAKEPFTIYYGNQDPAMPAANKASDAWAEDLAAVFHFAERGGSPAGSTANANKSSSPAATAEGSLIGSGLRLLGAAPVSIDNSPALAWAAGRDLSLSLWVKPAALDTNTVVLSREGDGSSFRLLLDQGAPVIEIGGQRSPAGAPVAAGAWTHLGVAVSGGSIQLFINGDAYSTLQAQLPASEAPIVLGAGPDGSANLKPFIGDLDELRIATSARPAAWIKLMAVNQGATDAAQRMISLDAFEGGEEGGHSHVLEHVMLFGDIANNMMFDGWIAIGVCIIMIIVGWTVAIKKFFYLNKIERGNAEFLRQWKKMSTDLTALDHNDSSNVKSMGGSVDEEEQELMEDSPLYHIYHIGSDEIRNRLDKLSDKLDGLPGRSIQAIRASLDAGLVHENHRLTNGLVYLTISIAGGPYVGLLGTVVGVMITFAIIAKSGEVNVNSIAPGIASALLATVVGLIVAIPALFIYSYLNSRIKNVVASMEVFIDEFVAKMAEFYRPTNEA
ncbi:MAG: DUF2341 domain-containing protein [Akkermansiaceae bacterium]|nr:DUF2341 domain-containing protein [Akkermansiaceae bacterium]MCP5542284.1 DUF2341 domain-containing protein [Akkermansiaceae bacterium]MCP5546179.1 DUF2341 domain-containing protein [Akkermansiaceae bacterium]